MKLCLKLAKMKEVVEENEEEAVCEFILILQKLSHYRVNFLIEFQRRE